LLNSILGSFTGGVAASTNSFESIATVAGNSGTSVTLTSIPSGYTSLQVRYYAARDGSSGFLNVRFNGDTGSNYANHYAYGSNTTATAGANATQTRINYLTAVQDSGNSYKASGILDILDYGSTSKYKTTRNIAGVDTNSSAGSIWLSSGLWMSTSAITSITFDLSGDTFGTSTFALYGIKGS
jgi:hypothetical protein